MKLKWSSSTSKDIFTSSTHQSLKFVLENSGTVGCFCWIEYEYDHKLADNDDMLSPHQHSTQTNDK